MTSEQIPIERVDAFAYEIPTDGPEADGTLRWSSTTLVVVEVQAGGRVGLGYTYNHHGTAVLIRDKLAETIRGKDALSVRARWQDMLHAIRNLGRPGLVASAIAAVDLALWDLKARLLDIPLVTAFDAVEHRVPVYGSGGFTSYDDERLEAQLTGWLERGIRKVKMKVGEEPERDVARVRRARQVIGPDAELFVDANGAWTPAEALGMAARFAAEGVSWFEEPTTSDDLVGLRTVRYGAPPGMRVAAGEYGYDLYYFRHMLEAQAVDVLQVDVTRCLGATGFLEVAALAAAHSVPISAHTAPAAHLHLCCACRHLLHVEYFHDHARIERLLFDGVVEPVDGALVPDRTRSGNGLTFKRADAARFALDPP